MAMTQAQAREAQTALKAKGHDLGNSGPARDGVDGDYGGATHRAVMAAIATSPPVAQAPELAPSAAPAGGDPLSPAQRAKMRGVHPDLVKVIEQLARSGARFRIDQTLRTLAEQKRLVAAGKSQTLDSRHLTGHAVDLYPLDDVDHDAQPWDWDDFYALAEQFRAAAEAVNVPIRWGGTWQVLNGTTKSAKALVADYSASRRAVGRKPFLDGPHFELPAARYP